MEHGRLTPTLSLTPPTGADMPVSARLGQALERIMGDGALAKLSDDAVLTPPLSQPSAPLISDGWAASKAPDIQLRPREGGRRRVFMLLQGVCSPFFLQLAKKLKQGGHEVIKVNFNSGDSFYWRHDKAYAYRGKLEDLGDWIAELWRKHHVTDQVLFGDRRPVHRDAVLKAEYLGIRTHVFEEGYFRPYWVTLEREGVNGHSLLPRDPDWFREAGRHLEDAPTPQRFKSSFRERARHDITYHLAGAANPLLFPRYRPHSIHAVQEYAGYATRLPLMRWYKRRDAKRIDQLMGSGAPYYMLPLQLNTDAQIRHHSRFANMQEVIQRVMKSFALNAPRSARLVIKNHPLDMGLVDYPGLIRSLERRYDLIGRIVYLESGNLEKLLQQAKGMITVNSTTGNVALQYRCPTFCMGDPIFNLPGLTFQGSLHDFWTQGQRPDTTLFRHFRNTVIHTVQLNGGFYCKPGMQLAVLGASKILCAERSPLENMLSRC
ncbi:capsular biosynthesis protein [Cobetia amphilecti]|uniref:capsule biosynthesis protein n=2 Tax=Cobetia TaxID=204286 RepID=UPI002942CF82|nr:capsular biosynthesis protein [Cobetia amphilecti]WOI24910.1 capsular biosynthesis protein [Cobetia amphilecti]|tara:strand:- start:14349 stop:15818 length:1470 start_codon:yes stop_codon:yes gene_type:complete